MLTFMFILRRLSRQWKKIYSEIPWDQFLFNIFDTRSRKTLLVQNKKHSIQKENKGELHYKKQYETEVYGVQHPALIKK